MRRSLTLIIALSVYATSVFAQAPYLVKDLGNSGSTEAQSSQPSSFLSTSDKLFFTATTETNGREPWIHDAIGTRLLRDINSGTTSSNSSFFLELSPGIVIFTATDGVNGQQLWRSDGTEAGTYLLKIVNATTSSFSPSYAFGGKVFFVVDDGVHGREPWVTDGTAAGTQILVDTRAGTPGISSWHFFRFGNTTRFLASGGIWTTDGTPAGTTLDIPLVSFLTPAAITTTTIYFFGYDSDHGYEPWKSDGTVAGTMMIKDIRAGSQSPLTSLSIARTSSGAVFFADDGTGGGGRLWTTDGTAANTVPLEAFPASGTANYSLILYATSNGAFCSAGSNVWRTDGTQAGTYVAASMGAGNGPSFSFVEAFSKIYFMSWVGQLHLFSIDGSEGATPVNVRPDITVNNLTATDGKLWFSGTDSTNGSELWVSDDGTTNGTHLVANLAPDPARSSSPLALVAAGPLLYFHLLSEREIWRSDATSAGTFELTDVNNQYGSGLAEITPYRGDVYFKHTFNEFYRVNGVTGAASLVGSYNFDVMDADSNYIYLWAYNFGGLRRSDGTAAGTIRLYDPSEPSDMRWDYPNVLLSGGSAWAFVGRGLYRTEGTVETTRRILTLPENTGFSLSAGQVAAGGFLYSAASSYTVGYELWRTDGAAAVAGILKDINPGVASSNPSNLTPAGRLLFFTAQDPDHGTELWRSDGTEAGTILVKDIRAGATSSAPSSFAAIGDIVYFAANDGTNGIELWKSDGTEAGTALVRDIAPGSFSSKPAWLAAADGKVWFSATDGLHGVELWSSDGSEEGTVMVSDIIPGSSSSSPDQLTPAESTLFFTAATDAEGRELWAQPLTNSSITVSDTRTTEGNSGTHALRFTLTRHGVSTGAASVAFTTLDGTATAGTDYDTTNGTINFASGEIAKSVDVMIHGDSDTEVNESLFLRLSSPTGIVLQTVTAAGVIDDDDPRADLAAEILQNTANGDPEAARLLRVTNNGPSTAYGVAVTFTESPYDFLVNTSSDVTCTTKLPVLCTLSLLQPGESRTLTIYRYASKGLVDPSLPPGRTVTVNVTSAASDSDLSNNTASRMTTNDGKLLLPSKLVVGTSATATFDLGTVATSPTDVTLTSSAVNVVVAPATAHIETGQRTATFTLTTTAGANKTLLNATIASQTEAALVVPIAANGQSPLLDVAIVASNDSTLAYGELFVIPMHIAARYPDGTVPTGLVTLLEENGNVLSQLALDTEGAATFTRPQPAPGQYHYRIGFSGDARFHPLTVSLPTITIEKARATVDVHAPTINCSGTIEFHVVVMGPEGATPPTGTVTLSSFDGDLGTFTLSPNGIPGQSQFTTTLGFANGTRYVNANYSGDDTFFSSGGRKDFVVGCLAMNLDAVATSPWSVALSWTPQPSMTAYTIYRAGSIEGPYQWIAQTSGSSAVDTTALPGHIYVYQVGAYGGFGWPLYSSGLEIASTFVYTNDPLTAGTSIKSVHMTELRAMVAALNSAAALPPMTFSGSVAPGNVVYASQVSELRNSIDASRSRIGLPAFGWAQQNIGSGTIIRAATLQELRAAVQ